MAVAATPTVPPTPSPAPGPSPVAPSTDVPTTTDVPQSDGTAGAPEHHGPPWGLIALGGMMVAGMAFLIADSPGMPKKAGLIAGGVAGLAAGAGLLYAGISKVTGPAESSFGKTDGAIGKYAVGPMGIIGGIGSAGAGVFLLKKAFHAG